MFSPSHVLLGNFVGYYNRMRCQCPECNCHEDFEPLDGEQLLNVIQHDRLNQKQIDFAKKLVDSKICENCFSGIHKNSL